MRLHEFTSTKNSFKKVTASDWAY